MYCDDAAGRQEVSQEQIKLLVLFVLNYYEGNMNIYSIYTYMYNFLLPHGSTQFHIIISKEDECLFFCFYKLKDGDDDFIFKDKKKKKKKTYCL